MGYRRGGLAGEQPLERVFKTPAIEATRATP